MKTPKMWDIYKWSNPFGDNNEYRYIKTVVKWYKAHRVGTTSQLREGENITLWAAIESAPFDSIRRKHELKDYKYTKRNNDYLVVA